MEFVEKISDKIRPQQEVPYTQELDEPVVAESNPDNTFIVPSKGRSCTNLPFLIVQGCVTGIFIFFIAYCIIHGDIQRLTRGYDDCGNVCGRINKFDLGKHITQCKAADMRDRPILNIDEHSRRTCVNRCDEDSHFLNGDRCVAKTNSDAVRGATVERFIHKFACDLHVYSTQFIYLGLIALGYSLLLLLMLRYFTAAFVWSTLVAFVALTIGGAAYFGTYGNGYESIQYTISLTILSVVVLFIIFVLRSHIPLVIQLFKESVKSIGAMPLLLLEPAVTFMTLVIVWSLWLDFTLWIESAGIPVVSDSTVTFRQNAIIHIARWYNHILMMWMVCFVYGCQSMIVAGAVSKWYFAIDKSNLGSPVYTSAYNTVVYHLGTISCGSLILVTLKIIRIALVLIRVAIRRILYALCLCFVYQYVEYLWAQFEEWIRILTGNAYVITAMYGYPFRVAGKRAFEIIVGNVLKVVTITTIAVFVVTLTKLCIVAITVIIGNQLIQDNYNMSNKWLLLVFAGCLAYFIAHCFLSVFQNAANAVFVCFCEDSEKNDGMTRPYFMSSELAEFALKCNQIGIFKQSTQEA